MQSTDWLIFIIYLIAVFGVGILVSKKASNNIKSYFVADRSLPWWWIGISIIATTFAADTPLVVTGITAKTGVAGNWLWWSWAATYISVSVFFAKRWRQSKVLTDIEFIELRYSGISASFLRGFKGLFYGVFLNVFILGWVITAAVKIADTFIQWPDILGTELFLKLQSIYPSDLLFKGDFNATLSILAILFIVMIYSSLGGIRGVILTDLFQFAIAIGISIVFAWYAVDSIGGLDQIQPKLNAIYGAEKGQFLTEFIPSFDNPLLPFQIFIIYVLVQWWVRYDSDGSGYISQRLNTAKSAKDAQKGAFLFSFSFIVLRTWPWILVGLVSLILFPLQLDAQGIITEDREILYPLIMKKVLPTGLLGLGFTSLMAAFMSTVDTHLNWGASYLTNDIYLRFIKPKAEQKQLVNFSRIVVIGLTFLAVIMASQINSIGSAWVYFINAASGLGIAQIIRWFWWRANAWTEITAMLTAFLATLLYPFLFAEYVETPHFDTYALVGIAATSIIVSIIVTLITPAVDEKTLTEFIKRCQPVGLWRNQGQSQSAYKAFFISAMMWVMGIVSSFTALFSVGYFLMLKPMWGTLNLIIAIVSFILMNYLIKKESKIKA